MVWPVREQVVVQETPEPAPHEHHQGAYDEDAEETVEDVQPRLPRALECDKWVRITQQITRLK